MVISCGPCGQLELSMLFLDTLSCYLSHILKHSATTTKYSQSNFRGGGGTEHCAPPEFATGDEEFPCGKLQFHVSFGPVN